MHHLDDIDVCAIESTPKTGNIRPGLSSSTRLSSCDQSLNEARWGHDVCTIESTPKTTNQRPRIASVQKYSCWGELALSVADDNDLTPINDLQHRRESLYQKKTSMMLKRSKSKEGSRSRSRSKETLDIYTRTHSKNRIKAKDLEITIDLQEAAQAYRSNANAKAIHENAVVASIYKQRSKSVDQKGCEAEDSETNILKHRRRSKSTDLCDADIGTNVTRPWKRTDLNDLPDSNSNHDDLENSKHRRRKKSIIPSSTEPNEYDDTQIRRRLSADSIETNDGAINASKHRRRKKSSFHSCGESIVDDIDVPNFLRQFSHNSASVEVSKRLSQINSEASTEGDLKPTTRNAKMRKPLYSMKPSKSLDRLDNRDGVDGMPKLSRLSLRSKSMDPDNDDDHRSLSLIRRSRSLEPSNDLPEWSDSLSDETFIRESGHTLVHSIDPAFDPSFFLKKKEMIKNKSVELLDKFLEREGEPKQYIIVLNGGIEHVGPIDSAGGGISVTKTVVTSRSNRSAKMEASISMNRSKSPWPGMTSQRRRVEDPFAAVKAFQCTHDVLDRSVKHSDDDGTACSSIASMQSGHAKSTRRKEDILTKDTIEVMGTKHKHYQGKSTDGSDNHVEELMSREHEKKDRRRGKSSSDMKIQEEFKTRIAIGDIL